MTFPIYYQPGTHLERMELYEQYYKTIDNQIAFAWATDGLDLMYIDPEYKMLLTSEKGDVQRAPVEVYINKYLQRTIIAYKIDKEKIIATRCGDKEILDLEFMTCNSSPKLNMYNTAVEQCTYF